MMTAEDRMLSALRWIIVAAVVFVAAMFLVVAFAWGHDHNRPELKPWFESLKSRGKASCCDGSDATRLDDIDWESKDGHYRVRLNGQWVDVPEEAIVDGPNRAGPAMVWPFLEFGEPTGVRCFMPGSMS